MGLGLNGAFAVGNNLEVNYEMYVINGLDDNITDGFGLRQARGSLGAHGDNNNNKGFAGRIGLLPGNILGIPLNGLDIVFRITTASMMTIMTVALACWRSILLTESAHLPFV